MSSFIETLAIAIGECWWSICEQPKPWARTSEVERATFRTMARHAIEAGRQGRRGVEDLARSLHAGWCADLVSGHVGALAWDRLWRQAQEVFRIVAKRVLEVAELAKASRPKPPEWAGEARARSAA